MNTKQKLAEALKEEMKATPIPKIRIGDLTDRAGINRQTFYYHYHDIYDLVEDMYANMLDDVMDLDTAGERWTNNIYDVLVCLKDNQDFVDRCYHEVDHERYESMFRRSIGNLINAALVHIAGRKLPSTDRVLIRDFYTFAVTSIIIKWIGSGMKQEPEVLTRKIRIMVMDGFTIAASSFAVNAVQPEELNQSKS